MKLSGKDSVFLLSSISLIFINIPKTLELNFLFSTMSGKLTVYFLLIGFIVWTIKNRGILLKKISVSNDVNLFIRYITVYFIIVILSMIFGLHNYPYFDDILAGPYEQVDKLNHVYNFLQRLNLYFTKENLLSFWMIARPIKGLLLELLYTFVFSYMIYSWYKSNWERGIFLLNKGILISVIIILLYSVIELFFLLGNLEAAGILSIINPYIHQIANGDWWPPLLWYGQLRSLFAEPSYYGIYSAFAMPWLWYGFIKAHDYRKNLYGLIIFLFSFCLFLTKARTAVLLFVGEIFIFTIYTLIYRRLLLRKYCIVFLCSMLAFFSSTVFINHEVQNNKEFKVTTAESYLADNMASVASADKRSNRARYSIMEAHFRIGLDHPFLGVGYSLRQAYIPDYLPDSAFSNNEIQGWLDFQRENGIMKSKFPPLGDYLVRFAETGLLGVIIFLMPALYLLFNNVKVLRRPYVDDTSKLACIFFSISFFGILASGIGDTLNITYCYWLLLGIGYAMIEGIKG